MRGTGVKITAGKFGIRSVPVYAMYFELHLNYIYNCIFYFP